MSETSVIISVLKQSLRQRGITYKQVARALDISESSVKRLFTQGDFSLTRLEQVCALMQLEIADLLERTREAAGRLTELSEEQERELISDSKLLLVGILATSHWSLASMLSNYSFTESELVRLLARLDRTGIIALQPG